MKKKRDSDMEVQYQKNNEKTHYNNENLKINISNLPDNFQEQIISKNLENAYFQC